MIALLVVFFILAVMIYNVHSSAPAIDIEYNEDPKNYWVFIIFIIIILLLLYYVYR